MSVEEDAMLKLPNLLVNSSTSNIISIGFMARPGRVTRAHFLLSKQKIGRVARLGQTYTIR